MYKIFTCIIAMSMFFFTHNAPASYNKSFWPIWEVNNPLSKKVISHQLWQEFLDRFVVTNDEKINLVHYATLSPNDFELLRTYIQKMSDIHLEDYNRQEQLAYWINLYNALVVYTIARHYPISTIQEINISPGLFSTGPWEAHLVTIHNNPLSLDDINNKIIRPIWNDPRTHYALNNASIGAPNLNKKAFQGESIEQQLNAVATTYINSFRGVQVIEGKLIISKIYDWYEDDFGGTKQDVLKHLFQFAQEPLLSQLKHTNSIDSYIYNWHLNNSANTVS